MRISTVILTKNEEKNIESCLESVKFCNEIIVVDDNSVDKTTEIAKKLGATVLKKKLIDFASQRNFGLKKAKGEWILFIDADERVNDELRREILRLPRVLGVAQDKMPSAFCIKRRDWWWGRELKFGEIKKIREKGLIRMVKKNSGRWVGKVHEQFRIHPPRRTEFRIKSLKNYINHYPHPTLKEFLKEINFYSTLRAKELKDQGESGNIWGIIFFPLGKFILTYFIKLGFLDGPTGFAYAFLMSFHSFLVRVKLWQYYFI